jgi:acyl-CoA synthetase (AMP-forming)/AMP-acid ligase II
MMNLLLDSLGAIVDLKAHCSWSSRELVTEVTRRSRILHKNGVSERSVVALLHGGTAHFVADLLAVWLCGATAACLDPSLTAVELSNLFAFIQPAAVLIGHNQSTPIESRCTLDLSNPSKAPQAIFNFNGNLDDPALLLFTSGTTAKPKGVLISFRAILARIALNQEVIGRKTLSKTLITLPTYFGHGLIGNMLTPLMSGGTVVIPTFGVRLAENLTDLIDLHNITFLSSVPALWQLVFLSSRQRPKGNTLKRVHVGSAPLSSTLWQTIVDWAGCEVVNCYGTTETSNWIAGASSNDGFGDGKVGRVWGGQAAILNENGTISPEGEGEIVVQTPALMLGYFQRPDLTASVLSNGWYRTGDVGIIDASGAIILKGRAKDEINRAGFKIHPVDIDMLLESHPSIEESCCFGEPDPVSNEIVSVAVRLAHGANETRESLRIWCKTRIRPRAIPERWYFVDEIPRTERGKVSRELIRQTVARNIRK